MTVPAFEPAMLHSRQTSGNRLDRYLTAGLKQVDGWLETYSAEFIATLSEVQHRVGCTGAVGEIGVHHGKLFILLLLTTSGEEKAFAIDVFEEQRLNPGRSGKGDRAIFLANVRRWAGSDAQILCISRSSLDVHPDDILAGCGRVRLLSIDGGHTAECVLNDLLLADAVLQDGGVAVIDDYFNPCWPDVSAGVAQCLISRDSKLRPFAVTPNKVYLCHPHRAQSYRSEMRRHFWFYKESQVFGSVVDLYAATSPNAHETLVSVIKRRLKESAIGPRLVSVNGCFQRAQGAGSRPPGGWRYRFPERNQDSPKGPR
jgi:hypothetical protein